MNDMKCFKLSKELQLLLLHNNKSNYEDIATIFISLIIGIYYDSAVDHDL